MRKGPKTEIHHPIPSKEKNKGETLIIPLLPSGKDGKKGWKAEAEEENTKIRLVLSLLDLCLVFMAFTSLLISHQMFARSLALSPVSTFF